MRHLSSIALLLLCSGWVGITPAAAAAAEAVATTAALVAAIRDGAEGSTIRIAAGTYELEAPLEPKTGMTLTGAGMDATIITHAAGWKPPTSTLPDPEMRTKGMDTTAYLVRLKDKAAKVTMSGMTLRGPQLHGAIFGWENADLRLHHLRIQDTLWSGIRTFSMKGARIIDCEFIDAGGPVPASGRTFHIHHNWMHHGYSIEFVRNGVEIDHNFFDFDPKQDGGNLISAFGKAPAKGPAKFHNNLVHNPGRGVIWMNEVFDQLEIRNNHIVTATTATPRTEGLFGFNPQCDFTSITIRDNLVECIGQARPLLRCKESYGAVIANNVLTNVADVDQYANARTAAKVGLEEPLEFTCGVHDEVVVKDGKAVPAVKNAPASTK
jgi:hypothetical protein